MRGTKALVKTKIGELSGLARAREAIALAKLPEVLTLIDDAVYP